MEWPGVHDLVQRARAGEAEAIDRLCALVRPYLLRLAEQALGPGWPHKSVSDLTQETWIRAWQGMKTFRGGDNDAQTGALLRAWLRRTLNNVRKNDRRFETARKRKQPTPMLPIDPGGAADAEAGGVDPPAHEPSPSENVRAAERTYLVHEALRKLADPMDREIVRLRFFEGLSFPKIGERFGRDESTIRERFQDILQKLAQELKELR